MWSESVNWRFHTDPDPNMNGRRIYWPRGKTLGGSSAINAMVYVRGHRSDYDAWAALGNAGWSYDDVLPYFLRAEHNERLAGDYHGCGGPLNVCDPRSPSPVTADSSSRENASPRNAAKVRMR